MTEEEDQSFQNELEEKGFNGKEWCKFFEEEAGISNY